MVRKTNGSKVVYLRAANFLTRNPLASHKNDTMNENASTALHFAHTDPVTTTLFPEFAFQYTVQ